MVLTKHANEMLGNRMINMERQCRSNSQYSRRGCLEMTNIPNSVESKDLEKTVLELSEKLERMLDPTNVEH